MHQRVKKVFRAATVNIPIVFEQTVQVARHLVLGGRLRLRNVHCIIMRSMSMKGMSRAGGGLRLRFWRFGALPRLENLDIGPGHQRRCPKHIVHHPVLSAGGTPGAYIGNP